MAENTFQNGRQIPHPVGDDGKGFRIQLRSRAQALLNSMMNLLPSNYLSEIQGPNYTTHLKAFATELARITLTLEDLVSDVSFERVRSEFLHQVVGYLLFTDGTPDVDLDDEAFRNFLLTIIEIYFQGSTPDSIKQAVELFTSEDTTIREFYGDPASDISDQHAFEVEFTAGKEPPQDLFDAQSNMRLIVDLIRPAHTIFRLNWIFTEDVDLVGSTDDQVTWRMDDYKYDDVRSYWRGLWGFESQTGRIDSSQLSVLTDDDPDKPLYAVQTGANLRVLSGPNEGRYRVIGRPDPASLRVHPRFPQAETGIAYHTEIDRLGKKREIREIEDASLQIRDTSRLTVNAGGPYQTTWDQPIALTATASYSNVTYVWDLDGDNVYDDASGFEAFFDPADFISRPGDVVLDASIDTYQGDIVTAVYDEVSDPLVDFETEIFDLGNPVPSTVTLSQPPASGTERVFHNGLMLMLGSDYTVSGSDINLSAGISAQTGDRIAVVYATIADGTSRETFTASGSTSSHTLAATPTSLRVWQNGLLLLPGTDYTLSGSTINYVVDVDSGDEIVAVYRTSTPVFVRDDFELIQDGQRSFDLGTAAQDGQIMVWHNGLFVEPDRWQTIDDLSVYVWVRVDADDGRSARNIAEVQIT